MQDPLSWQKQLREQGLMDGLEKHFQPERVQAYYDFLSQHPYFFSKADRTRILERHLYESIVFCFYVTSYISKRLPDVPLNQIRIMDAGTGPGLPGFCFTCLYQKPEVFLLDSSRRKLGKLEAWAATSPYAEKQKLHFIYERVEGHKAKYDCITARAFVPLALMLKLFCPLQKKGGTLAVSAAQIKISKKAGSLMEKLGYVSRETIFPKELQFLGLRQILLLEKSMDGVPKGLACWQQLQAAFEKHD